MLSSGILSTSDKEKIAYYHYTNGKDKVIVIAHGFYNSKDSLLLQDLAKILNADYDVVMFDFRGHGKSSGLYSWLSKEHNDLTAVLNYVKGKYSKIGLVAFSLGGSTSINILPQHPEVSSFICVSAPSEFKKIDYRFWELDWKEDVLYTLFSRAGRIGRGVRFGPFWFSKDKPIDNVAKIRIPILYLHGSRDWVIKPWHSQVLYERTNSLKRLVIIEGGPHAEYLMKDSSSKFIKEIKEWFLNTLK